MLTINWQPSKKDKVPLYRQIVFYIKDKILTGQWPLGSKLPPQRELAKCFGVNRSTLRIALDELTAVGFIESKPGSGSQISNNTWANFSQQTVDWHPYLSSASYLANLPVIQKINQLEFNPKIIRLGTGELSAELLPTQQLKQLIPQAVAKIDSFGYQEPLGLLALRQEISRQLKKSGIAASPASILIVSGALQALQLVFFGLLAPNSHILSERPSYLSSIKLFQSRQLHFSELPLDQSGLQIDSLRFQQQKRQHALLYTIPTFHNPTGTLMPLPRRIELLQLCQKMRLPILEDNVYADLWLEQKPPPPLKALDTHGNVLYVDSLSKSVGPGLRIGWIVGPEPIIEKLGDLKMQLDYGSSILSQWTACEWLAQGLHDMHMQELRSKLLIRRNFVLQLLEENFSGMAHWTIPSGGFYIWLQLHQPVSMHQLFQLALNAQILLNPGSIYDNLSNRHLRISYAFADLADLKKALQQLACIIKKMSG